MPVRVASFVLKIVMIACFFSPSALARVESKVFHATPEAVFHAMLESLQTDKRVAGLEVDAQALVIRCRVNVDGMTPVPPAPSEQPFGFFVRAEMHSIAPGKTLLALDVQRVRAPDSILRLPRTEGAEESAFAKTLIRRVKEHLIR